MIGKNMKVGAAVFALSLGGGLLAGSVLGSPGSTSAAAKTAVATVATDPSGSTSSDSSTDSTSTPPSNGETPLTGDTATQVTAAAQAAVPDGTIDRVETDNDGVYEAHMTKADGTHVIVQVDANFAVTAIVDGPQGGGHGGGPGAGETPLTGDTATQVTAAAQAAIPDGTIIRVETDSDGVYEAHMTKADGTEVIVQVDANFNVTATLDAPQGGGHHGHQPPADQSSGDSTATTAG